MAGLKVADWAYSLVVERVCQMADKLDAKDDLTVGLTVVVLAFVLDVTTDA
jgi:hypothetical protein